MSGDSNALILAALQRLETGQTQLYTELTARMELLQAAVAAIETRNSVIETRISVLEARLDAQDETLSRFRADLLDELGRTRNALMSRMDRLQEALVSQHEADVVNFGATERSRADC